MSESDSRSESPSPSNSFSYNPESNEENPFRTPPNASGVSTPAALDSQPETEISASASISGSQDSSRQTPSKGTVAILPAGPKTSVITTLPLPTTTSSQGVLPGSRFYLGKDGKRLNVIDSLHSLPVSPGESSLALPFTLGGIDESDPAFQRLKSRTPVNDAENPISSNESLGSPLPNISPDVISSAHLRPQTAGASTARSLARPGARDISSAVSSVFYQRPGTANFNSRLSSRAGVIGSASGGNDQAGRIPIRRHFVSRRLPLGYSAEKPWLKDQSHAERISSWIIIVSFILGLGIIGVLTWVGTTQIINYKYCTVLEDTFSEGFLNTTIWSREVQLGGFGNGEFEWATDSTNNSFVRNNNLYIVPTYTADSIGEANMMNGYTVNLTTAGTCTSTALSDCAIASNSTLGQMIPPIMSARLTTKKVANIRYGKVEVTAKLPQGDWIWPAIWMMPTNSVYGVWPASGEIDIAESRGNDHTYPPGGVNVMSSTLHWGPAMELDQYWRTHNALTLKQTTFADGFHTFGLEWSDQYIMTYLDGRLRTAIYHQFTTPFWTLGGFPSTYSNGSRVSDPWPSNFQAPFDQEFYLILSVAVGGTNGWFPDNIGNKPWNNGDWQTAMMSFWNGRGTWQPTWATEDSRSMIVSSVKVYSIC
ncbi:concanavalin A-like lectin/glucanase domain-containing protein [Lipomyces kononenkoae]